MPELSDAREYVDFNEPFALKRGGFLHGVRLAYETWGKLNAAKDNVVLLYTGMSPSAHAAQHPNDLSPGWWEDMVGPGKPIDTQRWFVICANSLGSCRGSTGPASINPATGTAYRMDFPDLSVEDIAVATHQFLRQIGIHQVKVAVGCSMGGMTTLAHAALFPGQAEHAVLMCTAARAEAFAIAIRSLQRQLVMHDAHFQNGQYARSIDVNLGMGLARKLGVISYRSAEEWRVRFGRQRVQTPSTAPFATEFEVERYLEGHASRWAGSFDPCSYVYLSRAMDWFDLSGVSASGDLSGVSASGDLSGVSASGNLSGVSASGDLSGVPAVQQDSPIKARRYFRRALVLGVATDILFPLSQQAELAQILARGGTQVSFSALPSIQGHDAFLVDMENFGPAVARFMSAL
jgi:homoserine O-acetyltransferase/O-succinyltransferase